MLVFQRGKHLSASSEARSAGLSFASKISDL
jgi:hypothetical protein